MFNRDQRSPSASIRLLFAWLIFVIAGTMAPFNFGWQQRESRLLAAGAYERDPVHFLLNMLLFLPLGALAQHEGQHRGRSLASIAVLVGVCGCAIALALECLQVFLPSRDSSLFDVVANSLGALAGVAAGRFWGVSVDAAVTGMRERTSTIVLATAIATVLVAVLVISAVLQARTRLSNWSADYPLVIGNEQTGDRPWHGRVLSIELTDRATPFAQVQQFAADGTLVAGGAPVAAFDLTGTPPFKDATGRLPHLRPSPGAGHAAKWFTTAGPATALAERLKQTNAFTLRVRCATAETDQTGPARIVSNSLTPLLRNFTLGQQGDDLVFRLRTPATGVNGYPLELFMRGVFAGTAVQDIAISYDGATVLMAVGRSHEVSRAEMTPGSSAVLAASALRIRSDELGACGLAYIASVSVFPALLVALFGRTKRLRQLLSAGWVLAFAGLFEATLVIASGRGFDWQNVATAATVAGLVFGLLALIVAQSTAIPLTRSN